MNKRYSMGLALGAALVSGPAMAGMHPPPQEEVVILQIGTDNQPSSTGSRDRGLYTRARSLNIPIFFASGGFPQVSAFGGFPQVRGSSGLDGSGLSAGEHEDVRRINIWANGAYSNYDDSLSSTDMDGRTWNATVGVDYMFLDWLIAGVSVGGEDTHLDTNYNRGQLDMDGVTVSPYVLFLLNQYIAVDGAVGYSDLDIDQDRTLPGTATVVTSSLDADRVFGAAGINASVWRGNWNFSGRLGYFYTTQDNDAFVESDGTVNAELDTQLGQAQLSGRVAYYAGIAMPYVSVAFNYDTTHDLAVVGAGQEVPSGDRGEFVIAAGADFFVNDMISAGVRADTVQGRANYNAYSASGNVSFRF